MKIKGQIRTRRAEVIELSCGESVTVYAPSLGLGARSMKAVPPPAPKVTRVHVKGQPTQLVADEHDPAFKVAEARATLLQSIYMAWEVLKDSADVEFTTEPGPKGPDRAFVEALAEEMEAAAITEGDIVLIAKFAARSAGVTNEELNQAEGFSGAPAE